MSYHIHLSGPMGNGIRPKKYFGVTKELIKQKVLKNSGSLNEKYKKSEEKLFGTT